MQCKGRYCKESKELKFPLVSGYFTEVRCENHAIDNSIDKELCLKCAEQKKAGFRYKNQQSYYQGKVDEPYFENSWLFGSPRFLKLAAKPGNALSSEAQKAAEEAQQKARVGGQMKEGTAPEAKKKVGRPRGATKVENKVIQPKQKKVTSVKSVAVESAEEPIIVESIAKIWLKPLHFKGVSYWHDEATHHIYESSDGSIGSLYGRWSPTEEKITRIFRSLEK